MDKPNVERFGPGDVVRITVDFQHKMRIKEAYAVFVHEEDVSLRFDMYAKPHLFEDQQNAAILQAWRSHADFVAEIPGETSPGVYSLQYLELTTYGGKTYSYEGEKLGDQIAAFRVVPESEDPPVIEGSGYSRPPS